MIVAVGGNSIGNTKGRHSQVRHAHEHRALARCVGSGDLQGGLSLPLFVVACLAKQCAAGCIHGYRQCC